MQISRKVVSFLLIYSSVYASDSILSQDRIESLDLSQKKINIDSAKQKIDWVNPINFSYKKNISVPTQDTTNFIIPNTKISTISINQPIFKSGGIYNAIKYSTASQKYQTLDTNIQRKSLIKDTTTILFQLNQIDLNIKKQSLKIENAKIDVKIKQEQVLNNILDMTFLNNAIIALNQNKISLEDLKLSKIDLENKFDNLSSKTYTNFSLPVLSIIKSNDFISNNIYIKKAKLNEKSQDYYKKIILSNYLPTLSLTHDYSNYHDRNVDTSTTGIKLSIPLDIKSYYDTQSSKISYLKAKKQTDIIKNEEINYIKSVQNKIKTIENKIQIQESTINYYSDLITTTIDLKNNGLKTSDDVNILQNSSKIEKLSLQIFEIDKQIQLLEAYARTN